MAGTPIQIKRYPNRRYYARNTSQYVSLPEIEEMVQNGQTVEIRDSQSGDDLTRTVLTQIIMERQPEKMSLFPADMLHCIVRSNDAMSDFLRDYFRHSLTYLDYLQRHSTATPLTQPMHWVKAWLEGASPQAAGKEGPSPETAGPSPETTEPPSSEESRLAQRVQELEQRLHQLESKEQ